MRNDKTLPFRRAAAKSSWASMRGSVIPCHSKLLSDGDPRLVGIYYRLPSVTRCIVRLEWPDGVVWVVEALDAPGDIHCFGADASRYWADQMCDRICQEWHGHELREQVEQRRAA
jgi:hypothetical protein